MAEGGERRTPSGIFLAGKYTPVEREPVQEDTLLGLQKEIVRNLGEQKVTLNQFLGLSVKNSQELAEDLKRLSPQDERKRWVDVEHSQDFYTRFQPNLEPRFYTLLEPRERKLFDARWQLARAAFVKKAMANFPDKYKENQDLMLLGKDQMEILYEMRGVQKMLQGYAEAIVDGLSVSGKRIWECNDQNSFEAFRKAMRENALPGLSELQQKEADAVAWNLMWVGLLVESADSRYSFGGERHGDLPAMIVSDEFRSTLHPQEKWESKNVSRHFWGAFGKWGVVQFARITRELGGVDTRKDEVVFLPARPGGDWDRRITGSVRDADKRRLGGRRIEIFVPECYPTTTTRSFFEETRAENGAGQEKTLLEMLLAKETIKWENVKADAWSIYVSSKFNKAVALAEYYNPGKPMEQQKFGYVKEWANPFLELLVRLSPERYVPAGARSAVVYNLKFWAILAAHDGVKDPTKRYPTLNLPFGEATQLAGALASKRVGFFSPAEARRLALGV